MPRSAEQQTRTPAGERRALRCGRGARLSTGGNQRLGARNGAREALVVKRLQQVVDRADREGIHRAIRVRGHEDDVGMDALAGERLHQLEAVELRHADVEQQQLRRELARVRRRLGGGVERAHDVDLGIRAQQPHDPLARQRLIVHHEGRNGADHLRAPQTGPVAAARRTGRSSTALVPPSAFGPTVSRASLP